jgi:hypothetical protein
MILAARDLNQNPCLYYRKIHLLLIQNINHLLTGDIGGVPNA